MLCCKFLFFLILRYFSRCSEKIEYVERLYGQIVPSISIMMIKDNSSVIFFSYMLIILILIKLLTYTLLPHSQPLSVLTRLL